MNDSLVQVELGDRSYPILIESGLLSSAVRSESPGNSSQIAWSNLVERLQGRRGVIVIDENVASVYLATANRFCDSLGLTVDPLVLPAGETTKSISALQTIWDFCAQHGHTRRSVVVAVGGGVVGDLAGFAAATLMRGVDWIQIPTTLMAQVDSSVGGKTGINLSAGKNLVGAFWQPQAVFIDPAVLQTLDARQYRAGLAEVVKYAVIMDVDFFQWLESHTPQILQRDSQVLGQLVARCCRLKAQVVGDDERELTGRRAILNYGHTFGHALEAVFGYGEWLHGEAVACGMELAMRTARELGWITEETMLRQRRLLLAFGLPVDWMVGTVAPSDRLKWIDRVLASMARDKKNDGRGVQLILPRELGRVESVNWPGNALIQRVLEVSP